MAKKKTSKSKNLAASKRYQKRVSRGEETQFFDWLREKVRHYCQDPSLSKQDQFARREELADHLKIKETTLKGQYLYGQNKENIYKAALYIGAIDENVLMQFIESYPALTKELKALPPHLKKFYRNFRKLNAKEQELLSDLVENLLNLNAKYEGK